MSEEKLHPRDLPQTDKVRQGVTGHGVRYVLGFGLVGAIIALIVVYVLVSGNA